MRAVSWLKNAFAVPVSSPVVPTAAQAAVIDAVCREIVRRQMVLPAQMMLESSAPLHFLTGQLLRFFEPFLSLLLAPTAIQDFATFLEKQGAVEYLSQRLSDLQGTSTES